MESSDRKTAQMSVRCPKTGDLFQNDPQHKPTAETITGKLTDHGLTKVHWLAFRDRMEAQNQWRDHGY